MKNIKLFIFKFLLASFGLACFFATGQSISDDLKSIPVQYNGRIQPFDTFARDSFRFIYGKTRYSQRSAIDIILSWTLVPDFWIKENFIRLEEASLRKAFQLSSEKKLFSPEEILNNRIFIQEIQNLRTLQQSKENLNSYFKAVQKLENKLQLFIAIQRGVIPGWVPPLSLKNENIWLSLSGLEQITTKEHKKTPKEPLSPSYEPLTPDQTHQFTQLKEAFQNIISTYISSVSLQNGSLQNKPLTQKTKELRKTVSDFQQLILEKDPLYEKHLSKSSIEVHYNQFNPFRWSWILYLTGLILLLLHFAFPLQSFLPEDKYKGYVRFLSVGVLLTAFLIHGYGMLLRSVIMERPPVTNMYETVLWVPWVSFILGLILWRMQKFFTAVVCAGVVALFCLLLADQVPSLLDGRLEPLEAVLRSNFWLSTHVLIITMSYSAFFLAFILGDVLLFFFLKNDKKYRNHIPVYVKAIDRCIQVGVVLLATGTVLGGIWADYSWGRFWGWDPKETWALISLLGYLALLHGRLAGWVKEFALGVGAVLIFFLIVMAWYGVNYVLGQGLHSYGFGSGGVEYVTGFALLHLIYVLTVWVLGSRKFTL